MLIIIRQNSFKDVGPLHYIMQTRLSQMPFLSLNNNTKLQVSSSLLSESVKTFRGSILETQAIAVVKSGPRCVYILVFQGAEIEENGKKIARGRFHWLVGRRLRSTPDQEQSKRNQIRPGPDQEKPLIFGDSDFI